MIEQKMNIYTSQKRLQNLLNAKFELQKNIQPILLSEPESIKTVYEKFFNVLDETIEQETKYLNEL